ncbi:MAG: helix-turn-helix domain-containing protein [Acidobacteriota bacterium]
MGNIRELKNVLERACLLGDGKILGEREMQQSLSPGRLGEPAVSGFDQPAIDDHQRLSTAQREQILRVLQEVRGNKANAATLLGVSRRSLYRWLDRLHTD